VRCYLALLIALCAAAGTNPKNSPKEYPAHAESASMALGAEFLSRSVMDERESHHSGDYLVVEVALFPVDAKPFEVRASDFRLRINGAKHAMLPQSAGLVAGGIRHPEWERQRGVEIGGGIGDTGIILGGPRQRSRFPGDTQGRYPTPPTKSPEERVIDQTKNPVERAADAVTRLALDESPRQGARSGYLYFVWKKKLKDIKKVELLWESGGKTHTLPLR